MSAISAAREVLPDENKCETEALFRQRILSFVLQQKKERAGRYPSSIGTAAGLNGGHLQNIAQSETGVKIPGYIL